MAGKLSLRSLDAERAAQQRRLALQREQEAARQAAARKAEQAKAAQARTGDGFETARAPRPLLSSADGASAPGAGGQAGVRASSLSGVNAAALFARLPVDRPEPTPAPSGSTTAAEHAAETAAPDPTAGQRASEALEEIRGGTPGDPADWTQKEAADFTGRLADEIEAHRDDPEYVRSLMTLASPELQRSAQLLGDASEHNLERDDVERLAANFSRIGAAAPEAQAAQLAYGLALEVGNHGEQHHFDDGFQHFIDDGGDPKFRNLLAAALDSQGKDKAVDELTHGQPGILDSAYEATVGTVADGISDVAGLFGGLAAAGAEAAWDFGGDVVGAVVDGGSRIIGATADFAVDSAQRTLDFAGDAASWTTEQAQEAVQFAAEHGYQLVGAARDKVRELAGDAIDDALGIHEKIGELDEGDSFTFGGRVTAGFGVGGDLGAGVTVTNTGDGYDVSANVDGDVFLGKFASVGGAGNATFHFETREEAEQAVRILALAGASSAASGVAGPLAPVIAPVLGPSPGEAEFLADHTTSLALEARVGVSVDGQTGLPVTPPGFPPLPGLEAGANVTGGFRIDFENGSPAYLVRTSKVQLNANTDLSQLPDSVKDALRQQFPDFELTGVSGNVVLTVETRVQIDQEHAGDLTSLTNPMSIPLVTGTGENTVKVDVEGKNGDEGIAVHLEAGPVSNAELQDVVSAAVGGGGLAALEPLGLEGTVSHFTDDDGAPDLDLFVTPGFGLDIDLTNRVRDVTETVTVAI